MRDQRDAIDVLEGMPKRAAFVGDAIAHLVPATFSPGAPGWSEHVCALNEEIAGDTLTLDVPDDVATRQQGKEAVLPGGRRVTVNLSGATTINDAPARSRAP